MSQTGPETGATPEKREETRPEPILTVAGIDKAFEGVRALTRVSFAVQKGHIKALIGPNGAGKTTLLNIINGLLSPDRGQVAFQGRDITGLRTDQRATLGLSRTFQLIRLFTVNQATVLDNLMIGAIHQMDPGILKALFSRRRITREEKRIKESAMALLKFVGLEKMADVPPGTLSFGNQRLIELARSLMAEPDLLLLDEPASGLNDVEVDHFIEILSAIRAKGVTILLVEHNMKLVMNVSDEIMVLNFGVNLAEGTPEIISKDPKVIEAYLGSEQETYKRSA